MKKALKQGLDRFEARCWWAWAHKLRVAVLAVVLAVIVPEPIRSQFVDPCCAILAAGLSTISSTLSSVIGGGLNDILSIEQTIQNFEQTVVWPQQLINQAKALVGSTQGIYTQIENVINAPVNSATLPSTQQLEQISAVRRFEPDRPDQRRTIQRCTVRFQTQHRHRSRCAIWSI